MAQPPRDRDQPTTPDELPPYPFPDPRDREASEPEEPMSVLCTVVTEEALAACGRLEREGIPAELAEAAGGKAAVLVRDADLLPARALLARPEQPPADDDEDLVPDSYYVEMWVCPRCRERDMHYLPPSPWLRRARWTWLTLLLSPLIVWTGVWVIGARPLIRALDRVPWWWYLLWITVTMLWAALIPWPGRTCRKCGWRSDTGPHA